MNVRKSKDFKNVIIQIDDLRRMDAALEQLFVEDVERTRLEKSAHYTRVTLKKDIAFEDDYNISFESFENSLGTQKICDLQDIAIRRCQAIKLEFFSTIDEKRVSISIKAGSRFSGRMATEAASADPDFVTKFMAKIDDIGGALKPQNTAMKTFLNIFGFPLILVITFIIKDLLYDRLTNWFAKQLFSSFELPEASIARVQTQ